MTEIEEHYILFPGKNDMKILEKIKALQVKNPSEQALADFILKDPYPILYMSDKAKTNQRGHSDIHTSAVTAPTGKRHEGRGRPDRFNLCGKQFGSIGYRTDRQTKQRNDPARFLSSR